MICSTRCGLRSGVRGGQQHARAAAFVCPTGRACMHERLDACLLERLHASARLHALCPDAVCCVLKRLHAVCSNACMLCAQTLACFHTRTLACLYARAVAPLNTCVHERLHAWVPGRMHVRMHACTRASMNDRSSDVCLHVRLHACTHA
eukprot:349837-Chlamydomonas_euryale.AAC.4